MNGCRLICLKWIIRLSEGVLFSIIYNLLQFFPIDRRFHRILNRNLPIRHARQRVRDDLAWFINKFDYKYQNEPWYNAKDSVIRSLVKTNGVILDE